MDFCLSFLIFASFWTSNNCIFPKTSLWTVFLILFFLFWVSLMSLVQVLMVTICQHYLSSGSSQRLDLFIKVLRVLCPNLPDASFILLVSSLVKRLLSTTCYCVSPSTGGYYPATARISFTWWLSGEGSITTVFCLEINSVDGSGKNSSSFIFST